MNATNQENPVPPYSLRPEQKFAKLPRNALESIPTSLTLRQLIAECFSAPTDIRRIAKDAEVNITNVAFDGRSAATWANLIDAAFNQGKLGKLLDVITVDNVAICDQLNDEIRGHKDQALTSERLLGQVVCSANQEFAFWPSDLEVGLGVDRGCRIAIVTCSDAEAILRRLDQTERQLQSLDQNRRFGQRIWLPTTSISKDLRTAAPGVVISVSEASSISRRWLETLFQEVFLDHGRGHAGPVLLIALPQSTSRDTIDRVLNLVTVSVSALNLSVPIETWRLTKPSSVASDIPSGSAALKQYLDSIGTDPYQRHTAFSSDRLSTLPNEALRRLLQTVVVSADSALRATVAQGIATSLIEANMAPENMVVIPLGLFDGQLYPPDSNPAGHIGIGPIDRIGLAIIILMELAGVHQAGAERLRQLGKRLSPPVRAVTQLAADPSLLASFLESADAETCRMAWLAELLGGRRHVPSPRDAEVATTVISIAEKNTQLRSTIASLPACAAVLQALIESPAEVRVAAGLVTLEEATSPFPPWFGFPIESWRRSRPLTVWER